MLCTSEISRAEEIRAIEEAEQAMIPCCECPEDRLMRPPGWKHKKKKVKKAKKPWPPSAAGDDEPAAAMTAADDDVTPASEY